METKPFSLQSPENIAKEYGGNKQKIAQAAQMGIVDPTAAVLAGMFIDRMRGAQMQEQAPPPTVAQQVFAPTAPPQSMTPQGMPPQGVPPQQPMPQGAPQAGAGLEALPVPADMFGAPGMASGGLVAFAEAGKVGTDALEEQRRKDREALSQAGILGPLVSAQESVGSMFDWLSAQRERDKQLALQREQILSGQVMPPMDLPTDMKVTPEGATVTPKVSKEDLKQSTDLGGRADQVPPVVKAPSEQKRDSGGVRRVSEAPPERESALDQYAKMLLGSVQDRETAQKDARNMALLQAGLGIMGGTSQYAAENIARGALPATQSYQQQMQQFREDERKTVGALADLELKAKELGLTEKRYNDLVRIAEMQVAATQGKTTGGFTEKDYITEVLKQINAIRSELQNSGKSEEEIEAMAIARVNRVINPSASTAQGPRTVDLKDLK
jgi:hypothetical protein